MEKKKYIEPKIEVTTFDSEDIMVTSGDHTGGGGGGIVLPDDEW